MTLLYDLALFLTLMGALPYLLPKVLLGGHGLKERLGLWPREFFRKREVGPMIWVHAASVGEVHSLTAFLPVLRRETPGHRFILSVTTRAGRERAVELQGEICRVFYLPLDLSWLMKRVFRMANPKILLVAETELWPNMILQAKRRGIKVALINGRMSARSYSRYRLFRGFMAQILACVELFCLQTEEDARRFRALGADSSSVRVTGNFKGDLLAAPQMRGERDVVRNALGIAATTHVLVAGSTRRGEEEEIAKAIWDFRDEKANLRTIVVPRHVKRARKVTRLLRDKGLIVQRFSQLEDGTTSAWDVLVVDTLGQLMRLYSAADVAFVGGSLLPYGGHNPLEPASYGIPVLFGPHMEHCQRSADLLLQAGGGIHVTDGAQIKEVASRLLLSTQERHRRGQASLRVVQESFGTSQRVVEALKEKVL